MLELLLFVIAVLLGGILYRLYTIENVLESLWDIKDSLDSAVNTLTFGTSAKNEARQTLDSLSTRK
jgi:hypothetical protein